jgi:hypothetical protein
MAVNNPGSQRPNKPRPPKYPPPTKSTSLGTLPNSGTKSSVDATKAAYDVAATNAKQSQQLASQNSYGGNKRGPVNSKGPRPPQGMMTGTGKPATSSTTKKVKSFIKKYSQGMQ